MKLLLAFVASIALLSGPARAADDSACATADPHISAEYPAPRVYAAIARKQLKIVVIGTTSSMIGGANTGSKAYPVRLEEDLTRRLPGVEVKVTSLAKPRLTAAEAEKSLERIAAEDKPDLLVWQTGTFDAIKGVALEDFRIALSDGIDTLTSANVDVVLMNMQYSPRTESMIAVASYAETMRHVAMQHEVALFDRFAVMKHWNELGTFNLYAATKKTDVAERVHACIGTLLGGLIVESAKLAKKPEKDVN